MPDQRPVVTLRSARDGYCSACGCSVGTIAHVGLAGVLVRVCARCAKSLRKQLKDYAGGAN
jgi:threonine/homoserine/homoserine lactone efflux protein